MNGSPVMFTQLPGLAEDDDGSQKGDEDEEEVDDDDLPDPEAIEAEMEARAKLQPSKTPTTSAPSKKKRAPSLIFRQSLAPSNTTTSNSNIESDSGIRSVQLSDGRSISYKPLELSPGRIHEELEEGGLGEEEKASVAAEIKAETVKLLMAKLNKFSVSQ